MKTQLTFFSFLKARSLKLEASSGFTIIETLVAIAILLLSIIAPLTIAEKGLAAAEAARKEITAFYLAQEAIEYVRNVRDMNAISGNGGKANWLQGLENCKTNGNNIGCGIDPTAGQDNQVINCNSSGDCALYQYTSSNSALLGLFGHRPNTNGWTKTDFVRKVVITSIRGTNEAKVEATVGWTAGSLGSRSITVSENLFNWYNSP